MQPSPTCSVVVMGFRNAVTIERAVRSVLQQRTVDPVEVVVATSGNTQTEAAVRSVEAHQTGWRAVASAVTNGERRCPAAWALHFDLYSGRLSARGAGPVSYPDPECQGLSFDRELLAQLGPFDQTMRMGEDTDMARRMSNAGVGASFEPAVRTAHFGPRSVVALVRERVRRGAQVVDLEPGAAPSTVAAGVVGAFRAGRQG